MVGVVKWDRGDTRRLQKYEFVEGSLSPEKEDRIAAYYFTCFHLAVSTDCRLSAVPPGLALCLTLSMLRFHAVF